MEDMDLGRELSRQRRCCLPTPCARLPDLSTVLMVSFSLFLSRGLLTYGKAINLEISNMIIIVINQSMYGKAITKEISNMVIITRIKAFQKSSSCHTLIVTSSSWGIISTLNGAVARIASTIIIRLVYFRPVYFRLSFHHPMYRKPNESELSMWTQII